MSYSSPIAPSPFTGTGVSAGISQPAHFAGKLAADTNFFIATRTFETRAVPAAPLSIFEHAGRNLFEGARPEDFSGRAFTEEAAGVWSDLNDHAHVDRRAPPGRDPGGRRQGNTD